MIDRLRIIQSDCLAALRTLPDASVQCCVTSPPYWGLRDYGVAGQIGLEKTPEEYVARMVEVFREVRRVLRGDGTIWINLGDSYSSQAGQRKSEDARGPKQCSNRGSCDLGSRFVPGLKAKDLVGIPWRVAFALQADGWYLRSDVIWSKPNPMPESVTDRPTKAHEYIFLLSKEANYFYDAEAVKDRAETAPHNSGYVNGSEYAVGPMDRNGHSQREDPDRVWATDGRRNKRTVWTVPSAPYSEAHFATFPPDLIKPCILAGTSARGCCPKCGAGWERVVEPTEEYSKLIGKSYHDHKGDGIEYGLRQGGKGPVSLNGMQTYKTTGWRPTCSCNESETVPCSVLDCFAGSGTTGQVALELGRKAILIELNPKYCELIRRRCDVTPGLALA